MNNKPSNSRRGVRIFAGALLALMSNAQAERLTLNLNTLPSSQGWTFIGSPQTEAAAFTVNGSSLVQSTIGSGGDSSARYQVNDVVDTSKRMILSFTARITGYEKLREGSTGLGFNFLIRDGMKSYRLTMTASQVAVNRPRGISVDSTVFHDYVLSIDPDGSCVLFIDGTAHISFSQGCSQPGVVGENMLFFGDSTTHENTDVEITALSFIVLPDAVSGDVVPEHYLTLRPDQNYEAELATDGDGFRTATDFSDESYRRYIDFIGEGYIEWTVYVPRTSTFNLVFGYALGRGDRALAISVDGEVVNPALTFTRVGAWKDWSVWDELTFATQLTAGTHKIRATTTGRNGPDIDFLRLDDIGLPSIPDNVPDNFEFFGRTFSGVGDVDGDGFRDIAVISAVRSNTPDPQFCHQLGLYSGSDARLIDTFPVGNEGSCGFGSKILDIGDVNSDGVDDFGVTATDVDDFGGTESGLLSIYSGKDRALLHQISGPSRMVGVVTGDINGDSVLDLAVASVSSAFSQTEESRVFLISGATAEVVRILDSPAPNADGTYQEFGGDVTDLGDVNGDGVSDIAVGARNYLAEGHLRGAIFVFSGATGELLYDVKSPDIFITNFFPISGIEIGRGMQRLKDITGDSIDDFIAADPGGSSLDPNGIGRAFIFSGADGSLFRTIDPPEPVRSGFFGRSLAGLPDLNGDGLPEYAINQRTKAWYFYSGLDGSLLLVLGPGHSKILDLGDLDGDGSPELGIRRGDDQGLLQVFSFRNDAAPPVPESETVTIRTNPYWIARNTIDLASATGVWVAIMSRESFDPLTVSISSVVLGNTSGAPRGIESADRNHDGVPDLILRYKLKDLSLACGEQDLTVTGMTHGGTEFAGILGLNIIGCGL